ncbi:MAG: MFS transporter [Chloroflexi bacterium]|nr:MFS transporter [Chloroflexota bacterium]TDI84061.1 MAG: MFS transporter [Chloroflexota bacterium]
MRLQLLAITVTRTIISTGFRLVYPFLPVLARGVGVEPQAIVLAITARSGLGLASPILGSLGDLRGRRLAILVGVGIFAGGMVLVGIWPIYVALFIAILATGLSKIVLDPAQYAYLGDRVAFERRGTAMALVELSWSLAFLVGIPLVGLMIAAWGWQSPYPILAGVALLGGAWLWRSLPADRPPESSGPKLLDRFKSILARRSAVVLLGVSLLMAAGNEVVSIVFGLWFEEAFALSVAALGAASAIIGLAELSGEGLVAGIADRIGKKRSVAIGLLLTTLASLALPVLGQTLLGALLGLFFFYLFFEITIVSSLPLMTEQTPTSRSTLMATNIAAISLGRSLGALAGGPLFSIGLGANGAVSAILNLLALGLLLAFVRERGERVAVAP